jgi:hypothetical protein
MTPGAAALATLFLIRDRMPTSWRDFFVNGQQNWKAVVVPLVLGGLCYMIGVIFEGIDYAWGMKALVLKCDAKAFSQAWTDHGADMKWTLAGCSAEQVRRLRFHLWDTLVFKGGLDAEMGMVFAHCHRFQAEYKMFLHLVYPAILFAGFSLLSPMPLWWVGLDLIVFIPTLFYLSHLRNRRRWLQTLSFCGQLHLIDSSVKLFALRAVSTVPPAPGGASI